MIALIVALLYPIPLHCCDGVAMDVDVVLMAGMAGKDDGAISCCAYEPASCICTTHESEVAGSLHADVGGASVEQIAAARCDCSTLPYFAFDAALIASPTLLPGPVLAPFALPALVVESALDTEPCVLVGSPPPYLAALSHYIYLSTSVLLI